MKEELALSVEDIIKLASGKDSGGTARSAASLSIDRVDGSNTENLKEEVLDQAVIHLHISGGAAVVTADFSPLARASYLNSLDMCRTYIDQLDDRTHDQERLTITIVPYLLEGQITLFFTQMVFFDTYELEGRLRLILVFDNQASLIMETDQIDYQRIKQEIDLELKRYEEEVDAEIEQALEEEQEAKKQENQIEADMKKRLNDPLNVLDRHANKQRSAEENPKVRFVDEEGGNEK